MTLRLDGDRLLQEGLWIANDPRGEVFEGDALTFAAEGGVRAAVAGERVIAQAHTRGPNTTPITGCVLGPTKFIADGSILAGKGLVPSAVAGRVKQAGSSPQDRAAVCGVSTAAATDGQTFDGIRA